MNKTIYALGFFDGVHLGHAALLTACRSLAEQSACQCGALTFAAHPLSLVKGDAPGLISSPPDRERLLREQFHMDRVVTLPFDNAMRAMDWRDFLDMLCREQEAGGFVCGADFRFGHKGLGNAALLERYCREKGFPCAVVPEQRIDGIRVSSTYIRRQIETGDMATAIRFLGHPYYLTGTVVPGKQLGRKLGIPTANLLLPPGLAIPKFGVYACRVELEGRSWAAVTNVGIRPTVSGTGITVEPWILDYDGDLYGKEITLAFFRFLRPEQKFSDLEALKRQILEDARAAREWVGAAAWD